MVFTSASVNLKGGTKLVSLTFEENIELDVNFITLIALIGKDTLKINENIYTSCDIKNVLMTIY